MRHVIEDELDYLQIAVSMIESYPTNLIMKSMLKVDRRRAYLKAAYKFIKREKVHKYSNNPAGRCSHRIDIPGILAENQQ